MKSDKKRLSRSLGGDLAIFGMLAAVSVLFVVPFYYAIVQAFKPLEEIFLFPPRLYVKNPTGDNFYLLTQLTNSLWVPFSRYLFNSLFVTIAGTFAHVIVSSMAAFPLAKTNIAGKKFFSGIVVLALLFTYEVAAIPQYIVMANLKMINTMWALLIPPIAAPLGLFLMQQFMTVIDDSMLESAKIDGATPMRTFWQIVMPNVKPAWLTLIIFSFQAIWNREGLEFIYNESLKVLPTILRQISTSDLARAGIGSATGVILMIPPILTFVLVQSNVIETMAHSGIK